MEENKFVTLKLIGFNEQEHNNLSAILTLANRALKEEWQVVDSDDADFFLFSVQKSMPENRDKILNGLPIERCLFCITANTMRTERDLLVDGKHLPRLSSLVTLFNQVTMPPGSAAEINTTQVPDATVINAEPFFDYEKGLLGHLLAATQGQFVISLNAHPECAPIYVDADKKAYYSQIKLAHLELYLASPDALNVQPLSKTEIEHLISAENLKPRSVKELIWYITITTSAGRIIKGHTDTDIVALKSWPDLRMFKCSDYAKVATFMKNNAVPLETIATQTRMPLAEINNFYNACYLMGLIEKKDQQKINNKEISAEKLDLLTKIAARLK